ncbi:alpha-L-rhamnosidase C-terminal domain-containing protein [Thalassotalea profundi]|uniref:alpha-L-rhamnosidase C-terminal domain-containing protein n=1 Tax=Thalassotalea profundi TaxID=2036687 RepID=UPI001679B5E2
MTKKCLNKSLNWVDRYTPQLADLRNSEIEFPTLRGSFKGRYRLDENNIQKFEITIPANIKVTFVVSDSRKKIINFNDQSLTKHQQEISLIPGDNTLVIK